MHMDCFFDIDLAQRCAKLFAQQAGIVIRSVCCSETWHRDCCNLFPRDSEHIKCSCRYQQCQRGVKSAGKSNDSTLPVNVCQTSFQSHRLNIQDFIASSVSLFFHARYERFWIKGSVKLCLLFLNLELCFIIKNVIFVLVPRKQIRGHSAPLVNKTLQIQICINGSGSKTFALSQKHTIFCNQIMSAINNILRGFSFAGRSIDIAAEQSCRLVADQTSAIGILANHFITRRQIDNECRTV